MVTGMNNFGNFQNFMTQFQQLAANPAQYVVSNFGIPQNMASNPDAIIQQLMSSGKISQEQYNSARNMANQIQQNPMFKQYIKK